MHLNTAYLNADNSTDRDRQYTVLIGDQITQVQFAKVWTAPSVLINGTQVKHAELHRLDPKAPPLELQLIGGYWRYDGKLNLLRFPGSPVIIKWHKHHSDMVLIDPTWDMWRFEAECRIIIQGASQLPGREMHQYIKTNLIHGISLVSNITEGTLYRLYSDELQVMHRITIEQGTGNILVAEIE